MGCACNKRNKVVKNRTKAKLKASREAQAQKQKEQPIQPLSALTKKYDKAYRLVSRRTRRR